MEPTNKSPLGKIEVKRIRADSREIERLPDEGKNAEKIERLPDADEIERSPLPFLARSAWLVLFCMFGVALLWAMNSEMDRVVAAHGKLVTQMPNIPIQPLETSIIQRIDVRQGQVVKKGDRLALLDSTFAQADKELLRTKLSSLNTHVQRLEAEMSGAETFNCDTSTTDGRLQKKLFFERRANFNAQLNSMESKVARIRSEIDTNIKDRQVMSLRVDVLQEMEGMKERLLAQRSVAKVSLLEAQERRMQMEREMQLARNRELELQNELISIQAEKEAFINNWRQKGMEELLSISRERDSLREQLQKADKLRTLVVLTAPTDAVVLQVAKLSQGSVVKAAEPLFTLVAIGSELEAEVQIESEDIGYVKTGSEVRLKLDAFPFQKHGFLTGNIRTISVDSFLRETPTGSKAGAYYLARIRLANTRLEKMAKDARLLPGMSLTAEVVVGKRSVMSFFLWPVAKTLDESIQEP